MPTFFVTFLSDQFVDIYIEPMQSRIEFGGESEFFLRLNYLSKKFKYFGHPYYIILFKYSMFFMKSHFFGLSPIL